MSINTAVLYYVVFFVILEFFTNKWLEYIVLFSQLNGIAILMISYE